MKKLLPLAFVIMVINAKAHNSSRIVDQLMQVNTQWCNQTDALQNAAKLNTSNNKTFTDWIATHLMLVEQTLRNRTTAHLTTTQQHNRVALLAQLHQYWQARNFPINNYLPYKTPVFIDRYNNYCAVGYLMKQSGNDALAKQISNNEKFAYISQIKTIGVAQWAIDNGFTLNELAWIQPGYPVSNTAYSLDGGVNGTVNSILVNGSSSEVYVGGAFSASTTGVACNNIAVYQSGFAGWFWMPLGNGLNGAVNTIIKHNNQLIVGGSFTSADGNAANNVAVYDLTNAQWQSLGSLDGAVNSLAVFNNEIYAGGQFTGFVSKWNGSAWQDIALGIYGNGVRTLEVVNNELIIGGDFELPTGALRKNVCAYNGSQLIALGFGIATPVNDLALYNGRLYAACDFINGNDSCALAVYDNANWYKVMQPFFAPFDGLSGTNFRTIVAEGNRLYCGGNFGCSSGMLFGSDLMYFEQAPTALPNVYSFGPLLYLDNTVNCINISNSVFYFGGEFISNSVTQTLNHIGIAGITTAIATNNTASEKITVFPNPASEAVFISIDNYANTSAEIKIIDVLGNFIYASNDYSKGKININTAFMANGIYTVQIKQAHKSYVQKLVIHH
jgi:hypothetical protein